MPDIFESLAKSLNFTFSLQLSSDGKWGAQEENGEWNGMIKDLIDDLADISPSPLTQEKRSSVVDFLFPFKRISKTFVVRRESACSWIIFIKPFHIYTWISLLTSGFMVTISLAIVVRLGREKLQKEFNLMKCFIYVAGAFSGFAARRWSHTPLSFSSR